MSSSRSVHYLLTSSINRSTELRIPSVIRRNSSIKKIEEMESSSILESLGVEIISVMSPVSICMLLVVLLVYSLSSSTTPDSTPIQTAANFVYLETPTDSTTQKLEGALLNAAVFIVLMPVASFLLVLLYYYKFTNFLKNYMRFSVFFVFGSIGGSIFLSIIQHFSIPIDSITCAVLLFNFTILGVLSVFSRGGIPILLRQLYMVLLGIILATWLTKLPEWTTWVLLFAMALYDLVAVLAPGGPLKILIELASSRHEDPPALVYDTRPVLLRNSEEKNRGGSLELLVAGASGSTTSVVEFQPIMLQNNNNRQSHHQSLRASHFGNENTEMVEEEAKPLVELMGGSGHETEPRRRDNSRGDGGGSEFSLTSTEGIRLGMGDFVFYSVLVGRAAMYDLMTVYACYLAIMSGLGCTLILAYVCHKPLPALPISITLGIMFYFFTRLLMEPFVVGTSINLIMF